MDDLMSDLAASTFSALQVSKLQRQQNQQSSNKLNNVQARARLHACTVCTFARKSHK